MTSSAQNSKQVLAQQGSAAVPSYSFLGDQDTGVYRSAANEVSVSTNGTERMRIDNEGKVGIGGTPTAGRNFILSKNMTGGVTGVYGLFAYGTIQSDVTTEAVYIRTAASTAAASFNITNVKHFETVQGTFGTNSSATNQYGFVAGVTLTGATNNYGFYGNIASGANRWNVYMAGTADNYFAGKVGVGITTPSKLFVVSNGGAAGMEWSPTDYSGNMRQLAYNRSTSAYVALRTEASQHEFYIGSSEKVRIDSNGNVGIGTSTPANYSGYSTLALNGSSGGVVDFASNGTRVASIYGLSTGFFVGSITDIPMIFQQNNTEFARFDTDGNFLVGYNTNTSATGAQLFAREDNGNAVVSLHNVAQNSFGVAIQIQYTNSYFGWFNFGTTTVGSIGTDGSSTSYNTTSDYRLKTNVQPLTGSIERILAVEPSTYDWIATGTRGVGFIAHKLAEHIPEAVTGDKDAVDDKGNIRPQGVDLSKLVPDIVGSIQHMHAELVALRAEVAAMKVNR